MSESREGILTFSHSVEALHSLELKISVDTLQRDGGRAQDYWLKRTISSITV